MKAIALGFEPLCNASLPSVWTHATIIFLCHAVNAVLGAEIFAKVKRVQENTRRASGEDCVTVATSPSHIIALNISVGIAARG